MAPAPWLRILVYQNLPGIWVARSLEHDIAIEGPTRETAIDRILEIVFAHIAYDRRHGRAPLSTFPEAPWRYWQAFGAAAPLRSVPCLGDERGTGSDRRILIALADARPQAPSCRTPLDRGGNLRVERQSIELTLGPATRAHHANRRSAPSIN